MKKILAIALAALFALSLIAPIAADDPKFTMRAEVVAAESVKAGDTVTVNVILENNPGISSVAIQVGFDADAFSITSGTKTIKNGGDVFESLGARTVKDGTARASFFAAENTEEDGKLAIIVFTAKVDLSGSYTFPLIYTQMWNEDDDPVVFDEIIDGTLSFAAPADPTPSIDMSATVGEGEVQGNIYVTVPDGFDAADYTVTVNGNTQNLGELTATANGYKVSAPAVAPKMMGDEIPYSISYQGTEVASGTTSLKAYAEGLAADPATAELGNAMLAYGAAAQKAFGYNTDALITDAVVTDQIIYDRFDGEGLNEVLTATDEIPVYYSALNLTYLAEIKLSIAFTVKATATAEEALEWVNTNITLDGEPVQGRILTSGNFKFIVISKAGITIDAVNDPIALVAAGSSFNVSPANYLASVEAVYANNPAKADQLNLARALFAYANAIDNINA